MKRAYDGIVMSIGIVIYLSNTILLNAVEHPELNAEFLKAVGRTDLPVAESLLGQGADVNGCVGFLGWTALIESARNGDELMAKFLIEHGADVNLSNNYGTTAFTEAVKVAEKGHADLCALLLRHGATPSPEKIVEIKTLFAEKHVMSPLSLALVFGDSKEVYQVLQSALSTSKSDAYYSVPSSIVNERDSFDMTALDWAVARGAEDSIGLLLEHGAEWTVRDARGNLVRNLDKSLLQAASQGKDEMVDFLLKHHARVNYRDNDGMTLLRQRLKIAIKL